MGGGGKKKDLFPQSQDRAFLLGECREEKGQESENKKD